MRGSTCQIGELAERSGVTPDALRYYERLGLLRPVGRTIGGFRVYATSTLERLRFIKQAQRTGLSLREIQELVSAPDRGGIRRCRRVRDLLVRKRVDLDAQIAELQTFRRTLAQLETECERALSGDGAECPAIETLEHTS
ncbi:MAG: heavy metal-responsive transcriptional regulator [Vicinamibacterales bacterium]